MRKVTELPSDCGFHVKSSRKVAGVSGGKPCQTPCSFAWFSCSDWQQIASQAAALMAVRHLTHAWSCRPKPAQQAKPATS